MKFRITALCLSVLCSTASAHTKHADVFTSLYWKGSHNYLNAIDAKAGDLYHEIGHHGPAIENPWVGYRMYFNDSLSIDILSKFQPRMELAQSQWYSLDNPELVKQGYGKDNFKVGKTVGLGGVRLWHKGQVINVIAQQGRSAQVNSSADEASFTMTSNGIKLQDQELTISARVSVSAHQRYAKVELMSVNQQPIQFVTGLTYHKDLQLIEQGNFILTWGDYDSPAASEKFNVGAALVVPPELIDKRIKQQDQLLLVTKPTTKFSYFISSANEKEQEGINTLAAFKQHVESIKVQ